MPVSKLVDAKVEDDDRLEAEEALSFESAVNIFDMGSSVEIQAASHEDTHHGALEDDPALFDSITNRTVVGILVKVSCCFPVFVEIGISGRWFHRLFFYKC